MSVGARSPAVILAAVVLLLLVGVAVGADTPEGSPCEECQRNLTSLCFVISVCVRVLFFFPSLLRTDALEELAKVKRVAGLLQDRVSVLNYVTWGVAALAAFFGGMTVFFAVSQDERNAQAAAAAAAAEAHKRE